MTDTRLDFYNANVPRNFPLTDYYNGSENANGRISTRFDESTDLTTIPAFVSPPANDTVYVDGIIWTSVGKPQFDTTSNKLKIIHYESGSRTLYEIDGDDLTRNLIKLSETIQIIDDWDYGLPIIKGIIKFRPPIVLANGDYLNVSTTETTLVSTITEETAYIDFLISGWYITS